MGTLSRLFIRGVIALVPLLVTLYVLYLILTLSEVSLGEILRLVVPDRFYVPGMGVLAAVLLAIATGLLFSARWARIMYRRAEYAMNRVPLVSVIYSATRDLVTFFQRARQGQFTQVVMVCLPGTQMRLIGFVTREDFTELPPGIGDADTVAVYMPMSYQIGGYTAMMPRSALHPIDMSMADAMRFAVTAGMSAAHPEPPERLRGPRSSVVGRGE